MLKTHLKRVIVCAILGVIVGGAIYHFSPKVYQSSLQVLIADDPLSRANAIAGTSAESILSTGTVQSIGTEIQMLRGIGLYRLALGTIAKQNPSFLTEADLGPRPNLLIDQRETEYRLPGEDQIESLYAMYEVEGVRESRAATITVKAGNPYLAADIANSIVYIYNGVRQNSAKDSVRRAKETMQAEWTSVRQSLTQAERSLARYKEANHIVDVDSRASQLVNYQTTLTQQLDAAKGDFRVQAASISAMRARVKLRPEYTTETKAEQESPTVSKLQGLIADLETSRTTLLRTYNPTSTRIRDLDSQIADAKTRLVEAQKETWRTTNRSFEKDPVRKQFEDGLITGQVSLAAIRSRIASLTGALKGVTDEIQGIPQKQVELAAKMRDVQINDAKLKSTQAALLELDSRAQAGVGRAFEPFGNASPETRPVAPDLLRLLVVCTMGGAIVGFLLSLARESLRATAQTSHELSGVLGLPVSATLPQLQARQFRQVFRSLPDPSFKPSESFKFMAFAMLYGKDKAPKRVLFTSVGGAVGCSTSAAQYAIAAAKTGVKVLLIDGDLRHKTLSKMFHIEEMSGVREIINCVTLPSEHADITAATAHAGLRVVAAGAVGGEGVTDVPVGNVSAFLDDMQARADLVVIDAPPCDVVSDALRFAPYVDDVCLVCSARTTKYMNVLPAIDLLKRAGAESVRLVMTGALPEQEAFSRRSLYVVR